MRRLRRRGRVIKRGDFVIEAGASHSRGLVLSAGPVSYDVVWIGGSTSRHHQADGRCAVVDPDAADFSAYEIRHLTREAEAAREERRIGARRKRGQVWPRR